MKTKNSLIIFSVSLVVSAVIVSGALVYFAQKNSSIASAGNAQTSVTDKNGNTYSIEKETPVKLTVISDATCENCDTEKIESWLNGQVGSPLAVRYLDFTSTKAKEIIKNNNATFLPYLLLDSEITKNPKFTHLNHHVISKTTNGYYVDLVKIGAPIGRYLNVKNYTKDDPDAPKITSKSSVYDFGDVKLSNGKVTTEFSIKNEGKSPLEFLNANTSCGCTSAQIAVGGKTSPVYMMAGHQEPVKWRGSLAPGEEGKIIVHYDPTVHPNLQGAVTREVMIDTNDPNTPQIKFKIYVNQIKD